MSNLRRRVDRLMQDARRISWKPHILLLTGRENEYKLEVHEWNGVPGSAEATQKHTPSPIKSRQRSLWGRWRNTGARNIRWCRPTSYCST